MSAALAAAVLLLAALAGSAVAAGTLSDLHDPFVAPRVGTTATIVRFTVTFLGHGDPSGAHVRVLIDGAARAMAPLPDDTIALGVRYRLSTTLPTGTHAIRFNGEDGTTSATLAAGHVTIVDGADGDPGTGGGLGGDTTNGGGSAGGIAGGTGAPTSPPPPPAPRVSPAPESTGGSTDGAGTAPGSSTGGTQATHHDASGAADHPISDLGGPASGGSPAGAPPAAGPADGASDALAPATPAGAAFDATPEIALGLTGPPDRGNGDPGGRLDDRTLSLLTGTRNDIPPTTRMLIAAISTTTTTAAAMAFFLFGKRRRDGEPPAPDEVLATNAATFATTPASGLVPHTDLGRGARTGDEAVIPRWRRPSLLEARKADPRYAATAVHDRMSFNHGGAPATGGTERRKIRYRAVSLLDAPDPLRSASIGDLDEGDEVQLLQRSGGYWLVLCPDGTQGWVHRMTLGDVVTDDGGSSAFNIARRSFALRSSESEGAVDGETVTGGETSEFREVDRSIAEDGTDLLSAYLKSRHA